MEPIDEGALLIGQREQRFDSGPCGRDEVGGTDRCSTGQQRNELLVDLSLGHTLGEPFGGVRRGQVVECPGQGQEPPPKDVSLERRDGLRAEIRDVPSITHGAAIQEGAELADDELLDGHGAQAWAVELSRLPELADEGLPKGNPVKVVDVTSMRSSGPRAER